MSNRILDLKISEVKWFPVLTTTSFREYIIRLVIGGCWSREGWVAVEAIQEMILS